MRRGKQALVSTFALGRSGGEDALSRRKISVESCSIRIVHMVGPTGVGKSTLLEQLAEKRTVADPWVTGREYWRRHRRLPVHSVKLDKFEDMLLQTAFDHIVGQNRPLALKINALKWCQQTILDESQIRHKWPDVLVIEEDGVFQCVPQSVSGLMDSCPDAGDYLKMHAVIHCAGEREAILERIRTRQNETGVLRPMHANKNDAAILKMIRKQTDEYNNLAEKLKRRGVPLVYIDLSSHEPHDLQRIGRWLHDVCHKTDRQNRT